ncbi:MAG TPA: glycosyltransferase [Pirellulales bacterium]|jgi:glycosyltransferase involved in cell wall biosynthesis|nr:glycosyltransferase [Pirellulales bacterium]
MDAVVFVSHYCPGERLSGSDSRTERVLRWFYERGIDVHFVNLTRKLYGRLPPAKLRRQMASFHQVHLAGCEAKGPKSKQWEEITRPCKTPVLRFLSARQHRQATVQQRISEVLSRTGAKMLWINHSLLAPAAPAPTKNPQVLRIIDTFDVLHQRDESLRAGGLPPAHNVTRQMERQMLETFDVILAIQDQEQQVLASMFPDRTVLTMGHSMDISPQPCHSADICFVGSRYYVNGVNLLKFLHEAWPAIRARCPDTKFQVVGGVCKSPQIIEAARGDRRIVLRGMVLHTADMFHGPAVVVCPLWMGSGLKIKMVEALSHGKATVTTPVGSQGLEQGAGSAFLVVQEPADFVPPIVELLTNAQRREQLETTAIDFARAHFQTAFVWQEMNNYLDQWRKQNRMAKSA